MYSPQGFVKQLSNGKWGYELTLSWMMYNENDGYAVRTSVGSKYIDYCGDFGWSWVMEDQDIHG